MSNHTAQPVREDAESLLGANMRLVGYFATRFRRWPAIRSRLTLDEVRSCCLTGLWNACLQWEPERGSLGNFAFLAIRTELQAALHHVRRLPVPASQLPRDPKGKSPLDDLAAAEDPSDFLESARLRSALSSLSPVHAAVLRARFGLDGPAQTLEALSQVEGITKEAIRSREATAFASAPLPALLKSRDVDVASCSPR